MEHSNKIQYETFTSSTQKYVIADKKYLKLYHDAQNRNILSNRTPGLQPNFGNIQ